MWVCHRSETYDKEIYVIGGVCPYVCNIIDEIFRNYQP